jgi:F0F1-type ATP synthase assembly protein I
MNEKQILICIHAALFTLQILVAALAITVDAKFAGLNAAVGAAQAFFPNPWKLS